MKTLLILLLLTPCVLADPIHPWGGTCNFANLSKETVTNNIQRIEDLQALEAVWLYDEDTEAKKLVDEHERAKRYAGDAKWLDESMYGFDYAKAADPDYKDNPVQLLERLIPNVPDETRQRAYRKELEKLQADKADRWQYFGLYGGMVKDEVRARYKLEQGFVALEAGWNEGEPHAKKARGLAVAAFGEEWVKEYESAQDKDKLFKEKLASSQLKTWAGFKLTERAYRLKAEEAKKRVAELQRQEKERQRQLAKEAHEKKILMIRIGLLSGAAVALAALVWGIKRRAKAWRVEHWASLICAGLLGVAFYSAESWFWFAEWRSPDLFKGYYTLLRLAVTITAAALAWQHAKAKAHPLLIVLWGGMAVLFQPIIRVELERDVWAGIDMAAMLLFLIFAFVRKQPSRTD